MRETYRLPRWARALCARQLASPGSATGSHPPKSACLYKVDRIGDFILATGAIACLIDYFGPTQCQLVVSTEVAPLAAAEFHGVPIWSIAPHATGVWREMRKLRKAAAPLWAKTSFRHLICLRHQRSLHRDLTLTWLRAESWDGLGPKPTAGNLVLTNRPQLPHDYPALPALPWSRELLAHRRVVAAILRRDPAWSELRPRLQSVPVSRGSEVVVCPFGNDSIRDYPPARWAAAIRQAVPRATALHIIGPSTRSTDVEQQALALRAHFDDVRATTNASLLEFVGHIANARAVLTVESAAAHIATALDKPTVIIMGGGHFSWFGPWGDIVRQRWVNHPLDCFQCDWNCRRSRVECLTDLPAGDIAQAVEEVMVHA